jgi:multidrug transporter EmrE-like cation transporter
VQDTGLNPIIIRIVIFFAVLITQITALTLLPKTEGFTNPLTTTICLLVYIFSLYLLTQLFQSGMTLSFVTPLLAALIPLATIAVDIAIYRTPLPTAKVLLLIGACGLIGYASATE